MPKIGVYFYKLELQRARGREVVPFSEAGEGALPKNFLSTFIAKRKKLTSVQSIDRSWHLAEAPPQGNSRHGFVGYGTFGYQSTIHDAKTQETKYERAVSDIEELPLYYHFWIPNSGSVGFAAFQSFGERSCVSLVLGKFAEEFHEHHPDFKIAHYKIMPQEDEILKSSPVKKVTLVSKKFPKDKAEKLFGPLSSEVDVEISFKARRRGLLGKFGKFSKDVAGHIGQSAFVYEGVEFKEAIAEVQIGSTRRKVGLLGINNNSGVIDITDDVKLSNGHPDLQSITEIVISIMSDFKLAYGM